MVQRIDLILYDCYKAPIIRRLWLFLPRNARNAERNYPTVRLFLRTVLMYSRHIHNVRK